ncbi:hypothetical protein Zm00014a_039574 [Zea mays]|uniref:Uncharacterized protein n=1 Tax=Zea mays TaxID=4577 RepID=A0A3L6FJC4_MAIZE|nr:hypothetical protein Zm00014a_039574 [Zea mays]
MASNQCQFPSIYIELG